VVGGTADAVDDECVVGDRAAGVDVDGFGPATEIDVVGVRALVALEGHVGVVGDDRPGGGPHLQGVGSPHVLYDETGREQVVVGRGIVGILAVLIVEEDGGPNDVKRRAKILHVPGGPGDVDRVRASAAVARDDLYKAHGRGDAVDVVGPDAVGAFQDNATGLANEDVPGAVTAVDQQPTRGRAVDALAAGRHRVDGQLIGALLLVDDKSVRAGPKDSEIDVR